MSASAACGNSICRWRNACSNFRIAQCPKSKWPSAFPLCRWHAITWWRRQTAHRTNFLVRRCNLCVVLLYPLPQEVD